MRGPNICAKFMLDRDGRVPLNTGMGGYAGVQEAVNHNLGCVHPGRGRTLQRTTGGKVIMFRYLKGIL